MADVATVGLEQLSDDESGRLARFERVIEGNIVGFRQAGIALMAIRDQKLYREKHGTFDDYVRDRWDMSRSRAYQLLEAAETMGNLSTIVDARLPTHESQVRPLSKLPADEQREAWADAVEGSGGAPTAADVQRAVDKRSTTQRVMHSSNSNEWYTPAEIVEPARALMGGIDLDPASSPEANRVVRAERIYTITDDGLGQVWCGRVLLNPPGGKESDGRSRAGMWFGSLCARYESRQIDQAVGICFNAATAQEWFWPLWDYPLCFFRGRTSYWRPGGEVGDQPAHGSCVFYLGKNTGAFVEQFSALGRIVLPRGRISEAL